MLPVKNTMGWKRIMIILAILGKSWNYVLNYYAHIITYHFHFIGSNAHTQSTQCPFLREACQKVTPGCDEAIRSLQVYRLG